MRALLQRVRRASVSIDGLIRAEIGSGLLVLLGVAKEDTPADASALARKVAQLRIFSDEQGKMNRSVLDVGGALLVVSQFTLFADARKGNRPSYSRAAPAAEAQPIYEQFIEVCRSLGLHTSTGVFQAHMEVELVNDGPVTILVASESDCT